MPMRIALLRGINVGGKTTIAMADLRDLFSELGFTSVRTLLNSGNVVFAGSGPANADMERLLEAETERQLGLRTAFIVRTAREWADVVERNPFPAAAERDPRFLQVMPLKEAPTAAQVDALRAAITGPETVEAVGKQLYLVYPDGVGRSKLTIKLIEAKLGTQGTSRNWNTVLKLAALVGA